MSSICFYFHSCLIVTRDEQANQTKTQLFVTRINLQKIEKIEKRNELISLTSLSHQSLSTRTQIINTDKHMQ